MASALIHIAVAKKVNEILKLEERPFILGSIAPDMAKIVGLERKYTHFVLDKESDIPNIEYFMSKYKDVLDKPFEIGVFVHLVTDVLWFGEFKKNFIIGDYILTKNGEKIVVTDEEASNLIYNDYTNLNKELLDYYNMDLSLFYEKFPYPESRIEEIKQENFDKLIYKMGSICSAAANYTYLFDIEEIVHFTEYAVIYCLDELKKYGIIK